MFDKEFYPTPTEVVSLMLDEAKKRKNKYNFILEPSAGKGNIADRLRDKFRNSKIDTIEKNRELQGFLSSKSYAVIHDDFLTFDSPMVYDLIMMNPPFSNGDDHLLKAIDIAERSGGVVICLLNSQTVLNPHTNKRKALMEKLNSHSAEVKHIGSVFLDSERKTGVDTVLIVFEAKRKQDAGKIVTSLKEDIPRFKDKQSNHVSKGSFIESVVDQYAFEARAGVNLIDEYFDLRRHGLNHELIRLFTGDNDDRFALLTESEKKVSFIRSLRYQYWQKLFKSDEFVGLLTGNMRNELYSKLREFEDYDFSLFNIMQLKEDLHKSFISGIENAIESLFDQLSAAHSYYAGSKNIHYYNGWKTNKAHKINKKVILPVSAYSFMDLYKPTYYAVADKLYDIERALDYLDGGRTDYSDLRRLLREAEEKEQTKDIDLKYFKLTFYKKGTAHIIFKDEDLLHKLNVAGSLKRGWLPESYGYKGYSEMNAAEKEVIESFEGKASYDKVVRNRDFFLGKEDYLRLAMGA